MQHRDIANSPRTMRLNYSVPEAAYELNVSVPFVKKEIARGRLKSIKIGRRRLVPGSSLLQYLDDRASESV